MNIWKKTASLLLVICLVVGLLPTTVFAAGDTGKAIQLVTDSNPTGGISGYDSTNGYDYIYYGYWTAPDSYTTSGAIKWRVLDTRTNMDNAKEGDGLFVLSEELLGSGSDGGVIFFNSTSGSEERRWQGSGAQAWCKDFAGIDGNNVADAFSTTELAAILETTKTDDYFGENERFQRSNEILNGDKVFFLSAEEASNSAVYGFSNDEARIAKYGDTAADWWLRSPEHEHSSSTGYVNSNGEVTSEHITETLTESARPAFNLDLSSVIFTSAADNSGHNSSFSEPADYTGNEWKLTLKDSNSFATGASVTAGSISLIAGYSAETLTISHASLSSLSSGYTNVTAMLTDSDGDIVYYGSINNDTSATSSTVTIPAGLAAGTYTLSIYGEDWNAEKQTDYATGTPFTTTITVAAATYTLSVTAPTFEAVTYGYTQPDAKAITIESSGNSNATISSVTVGTTNFTISGSGNTVAAGNSITTWKIQPAANLAAGTYIDTITVAYNNGETATADVSFTVNKADSGVTASPTANMLTYTGSAQALVTAGTVSGGTMYYSLTNNGSDWSAEIPTGTDAGTYIVYYKVVGDSNHNDYTPVNNSVSVTIGKAEQSISYSAGSVAKHINGAAFINELTKATVGGGITYASDDTGVATVDEDGKVTIVGAGTATITATAAATENYNEATASYTLTVTDHSYTATVVAPTYTEQGYTLHTCDICGGSYQTDATAILVLDGTDSNVSTQTTVQALTELSEGLKSLYSSVDALISDLISRVTVGTGYTADNALVYDVVLQYSTDGGITWITATVDNFPATGITVTIPYPEGTDASYEFTVLHMFTVDSDRLGITAGDTESPTVTKTDDGLVFTLTGLSPVAVSWKAVTTSATETETTDSSTSSTISSQTGDNSPVALWLALLSVSGAGVIGAAAYNKKR
ncbi:MAG: DUF6273 domain-containing protein, partial [Clostridiales bacterium]|nr:DUF6273 domain-containing protein [Clostridiales bacterium]